MKRRTFLSALAAAGCCGRTRAAQASFVAVLTRSYDNLRSGTNLKETLLTPESVRGGMRRYFSLVMEGDARGAEAQPLFLPGVVTADGATHNMVVTCCMNGSVHAYDADDSAELWTQKIARPIKGNRKIDMWLVNDWWSLLSTPVIDPETQTLYCVAWQSPDGTPEKGSHFIHALNLKDGSRVHAPVPLSGITFDAGNGIPIQRWATGMRKQRSSLLMTNIAGVKTIFFCAGSVFETSDGVSGWIVAYDVGTHALTGFAVAPRYFGGGIWMAGQGMAADAEGNIYGVTGNGGFDGITDFSECYFKARYTPPKNGVKGRIEMVDWFSPYSDAGRAGESTPHTAVSTNEPKVSGTNAATTPVNGMGDMDAQSMKGLVDYGAWKDQDLGSSGFNLIPELGIAFGSGKDGILYVMDSNHMGRTKPAEFVRGKNYAALKQPPVWYTYYSPINPAPADSTNLDVLSDGRTHHMHSTSVVWKSPGGWRAYCWGENSQLRAWGITPEGKFLYLGSSNETASATITKPPGGMPGGMISLSANGTGSALLWACVPDGDANKTVTTGRLYCYDAYDVSGGKLKLLWKSEKYTYGKFSPPVVNGGKVYVTTYSGTIDCYGLA